ncbi:UNVERIFIED_CONTAM: hypothetical protein PYX00_008795 [Menopon gallinae]|uniref:Solute carrier family 25 member 46 n=1 Tax=Menopon gallinae TaxID=328185 RepID=A0AAW2HQQ8_9NEOP
MAGLDRYPGYFADSPTGPDPFLTRETTGTKLRPTHLNIPSVHSVAEMTDDGNPDEEAFIRKHVGTSVGVASLITENLLSHPFVVLRRQCQVHNNARKSHLFAITLVPVVVKLHQRQGLTTLWKGLGSTLLIRGMSLAVEDLISKITPWPKEITWHRPLKSLGQHILLKCVTLTIMTPFYSASLVETVQSDIASEKPGVFDVFKDGLCRLVSWGSPNKGRMLPVWALVVPTVVYGLIKYLLSVVVQNVASRAIHIRNRNNQIKRGAVQKDIYNHANEDIEMTSAFIGIVTADVICYPLETILHRLHLQGTRTIVDNLDSGSSVIPILTNYRGAVDCYESTISQEGVSGLYKGFGALTLQFFAHWALIKLTKIIVTEISMLLRPSPKAKTVEPEIETQAVLSTTPSRYPVDYLNSPAYSSYPNVTP